MKLRVHLLILMAVTALGVTMLGSGAVAQQAGSPNIAIDSDLAIQYDTGGMITDQVIIEFNTHAEQRAAQASDILPGVIFDRAMSSRPIARYNITDNSTPFEVITHLRSFSSIAEVYPNYKRSAARIPNDPYYQQLQAEEFQVAQLPTAWDIETGSHSVLVGVIDTGVATAHEDLIDNLVLPGINVREGDQWPNIVEDDSGHGTAVCGVIGAVGNNGIGCAGTAWTVKMLPIRACGGQYLDCDLFDEVEAIDAARLNDCDIINLSIGGIGTISVEEAAVTEAYNAGIVIFSAAGNANPGRLYEATGDPAIDRTSLYYPAALPEVIGVGAIDNNGEKADFSNYGEDILSIMAPGVDIVTTVPDDEVYLYDGVGPPYGLASGTSFSTPMATGVAALILSHYPGLSPDDVRARIEMTAIPMPGPDDDQNGINDHFGYGILNAAGAVGQTGSTGNNFMQVGVAQSPIFPGEVLVIVKALVPMTSPPTINWSMRDTSGGGIVPTSEVDTRPGLYIGRFNPTDTGNISITVTGMTDGAPLTPVTVLYLFGG